MNQIVPAPNPTEIKTQPMKTLIKCCCLLGALSLGLPVDSLHAQSFVTVGAVSTNTGAQLKFVNGTNYELSSGYVQPLTYQRFTNRFGGSYCYNSTNLFFQVISATTNASLPVAAFGSYIVCQITAVTGPAGGVLSFWEQGSGWPTYQFPVGGTYATDKSRFILSNLENGAGTPGGDPWGSIRGRRFSVNKAGEYLVTFQLYDTSKNHPTATNAPIHAVSDPLVVKFATGVDLNTTRIVKTNNVVTLSFKQGGLTNLYVEAATDLQGTWTPVAGPFTNAPIGTNVTTMQFTNSPATPSVFYRLHGATP